MTSSTMFTFFFSSRRRHTICGRDWSSDVCSSDLKLADTDKTKLPRQQGQALLGLGEIQIKRKIGRASCRERVNGTDHAGDVIGVSDDHSRPCSIAAVTSASVINTPFTASISPHLP